MSDNQDPQPPKREFDPNSDNPLEYAQEQYGEQLQEALKRIPFNTLEGLKANVVWRLVKALPLGYRRERMLYDHFVNHQPIDWKTFALGRITPARIVASLIALAVFLYVLTRIA